MSIYEIKRDETDHRKVKPWIVLKDGVPMTYDNHSSCPKQHNTRRQHEKDAKDLSHDSWEIAAARRIKRQRDVTIPLPETPTGMVSKKRTLLTVRGEILNNATVHRARRGGRMLTTGGGDL